MNLVKNCIMNNPSSGDDRKLMCSGDRLIPRKPLFCRQNIGKTWS